MAEFNIFLGTARKSVGDVTLYRRSGKQVARVRVRDIANPKSEGQSETRNFLAPVIKFYAPLRKVLARSFEGLNKNRSYNEFQRTNIRMARANQWYLPKGTPFYPMPYQLSRGSISPLQLELDTSEENYNADILTPVGGNSQQTVGAISANLVACGYHKNDVVTLIAIVLTDNGDYVPNYTQFYVNPSSAVNLSALNFGTIRIENANVNFYMYTDEGNIVAFSAIVSRKRDKEWLRSTQYLVCDPAIVAGLVSASRRASSIASYGPSSSEGGGGVYPEPSGEPFNCQTISGRALLFYGGQYNAEVETIGTYKVIKVKPANIDEYFYIKSAAGALLGTNSAGSLYPPDWRFVAASTAVATDDVTIRAAAGTPFATWLATIGFVV